MTPSDALRGETPLDADARRQAGRFGGRDAHRREAWRQLDQASVMTVELVAAILTWGGIGWLIDRWLGSEPWAMGTGVMIGFAAGLYLVWLRSSDRDPAPEGTVGAHALAARKEGADRATD